MWGNQAKPLEVFKGLLLDFLHKDHFENNKKKKWMEKLSLTQKAF